MLMAVESFRVCVWKCIKNAEGFPAMTGAVILLREDEDYSWEILCF
jgi:hypothetical protein